MKPPDTPDGQFRLMAQAMHGIRHELAVTAAFSLVINALMLMPSMYMLQIYDRVMISQNELTLLASTVLLAGALLLVAVVEVMRSRLLVRTGVKLDQAISPLLFQACMSSQVQKTSANPTQPITDLMQVRQFITGNGVFAFFDAPWFFVYIGVLFVLHPWLGWMGLGFALVLTGIGWASHQLNIQPSEDSLQTQTLLLADQQNKMRNTEVIESMGMLTHVKQAWSKLYIQNAAAQGRQESLTHTLSAVSKFIRYTQQSFSLGVGALLVIQGEISPGAMIVGNMLMSRALQPLDSLVSSWRLFLSAQLSLKRMIKVLNTPKNVGQGVLTQQPFGHLSIKNVGFQLPGQSQHIVQNLSFEIAAGQMVCIVGPSGSGKTTLARLLTGIWQPTQGSIELDSAPLSQWSFPELGKYIGYLPQDVELMDGTLAQNIARFEKPESSKVIAAASAAGIHDMILRFPKGYDTPAGEAGHLLSAGQRQRMALARALYGEPSLFVFDEPNSNLDELGEQALLQTILGLKAAHKTVVLITHRPAILAAADTVLALHQGRVQWQGPRDQVLAQLELHKQPKMST